MRTLFLAVGLLLLASSIVHSQEAKQTQSTYTVQVDTSKVDLAKQLDGTAQVLQKYMSGPMETYYRATLRRNFIMGIGGCAFWLSLVITGIWSIKKHCKETNNDDSSYGTGHDAVPGWAILGGGLFLAALLTAPMLTSSFELLVAPDYCAMQNILNMAAHLVGK
jgi:hypothetical protein